MKRVLAGLIALALAACAPKAQVATVPVAVPVPPLERPVAELLAELRAGDAVMRTKAAYALAGAGSVTDDVVEALVVTLDEGPEEPVREGASWALFHVRNPTLDYGKLIRTQPTARKITRPNYPGEAYRKGVMGTVTVEMLIGSDGSVVHAEVRESVPLLDAAAIATVRSWTFEPGLRHGRPVPVAATAPVTFRIFE